MAKSSSTGSSPVDKKAAKAAAKVAKKERRAQLWQAFQTQRRQDKRLLPYMVLVLLGSVAVLMALGWLLLGLPFYIPLAFGLILGVLLAMVLFARRVQRNVYQQAEGTPGAAAWSLQNNLRGKWRITPAIAGTSHLDAVHRVVGRPGVILIGEGSAQRIKPLLAQEKKRVARIVGEKVPIYDFIVGTGEDDLPLRRLNTSLMKLPRNISPTQVEDIDSRLKALGARAPQVGLPKGPLPAGAKMRNVQRAARRR